MIQRRKRARDFLKSIKTVAEFNGLIESLMLTDDEKNIAKDVYIKGLSHIQIAQKYSMSIEKSHKTIEHILDRVP